CIGEQGPGTEICNNLDDDCDGVGDNDAICPGETSCVDGGCRLPCTGQEFSCPAGFDCIAESAGMFCVPSACASCAPHESCIDNACIDLCASVSCQGNESCVFGNCYTCDVLGCEGTDVCFSQECIADPCADLDCSADCAGPSCSCVSGACIV